MACSDSKVFCCCIRLDVGTTIIGISNIILSSLLLIIYVVPVLLLRDLPPARAVFYWSMTGFETLQLLSGCLLLYGSVRKKPKLIYPWTITTSVMCITIIIASVLGIAFTFFDNEATNEEVIMIAVYFFASVLFLYFVHVVRSYQMQLFREPQYRVVKQNGTTGQSRRLNNV